MLQAFPMQASVLTSLSRIPFRLALRPTGPPGKACSFATRGPPWQAGLSPSRGDTYLVYPQQ